jgi:outer membrane biosynthesis protein TonB
MATSDSLERRKEQKPESVHFWLAIVAGSLFFHSVLMFGVSRAVKVAVVEPGGGAIDVEMVDASGSKAASEGEPIVPASSFKPEPFRPEPTPLPEFSPEPILKPEEKPIVKPEVREEKPPIVQPEKKKPIVQPEKKKPIVQPEKKKPQPPDKKGPSEPEKIPTQDVGKPGDTDGDDPSIRLNVGQVIPAELTPKFKAELGGTAKLTVTPPTRIEFPGQYPLKADQVVTVEITLVIEISSQTVTKVIAKIISPNLDTKHQLVIKDIADNIGYQSGIAITGLSSSGVNKSKDVEAIMTVMIQR